MKIENWENCILNSQFSILNFVFKNITNSNKDIIMAVSMADITKLRKMTGAGMMDCKNALAESEGDFDKAMEIIRKKGQAVAAKRSDRETSEGCVLAKSTGDYAAMIALKCETDFVAKNADFVALTQAILDAAIANKCQTLDEIKLCLWVTVLLLMQL